MAEHGFNQSDVAKVIEKTEMTLRNKLQGKTEFTANELSTLAELFGVSPAIFFTTSFYSQDKNKEKVS
jgi:transcriptional regulator with XRE-family HTH domain